MRLPWRRKRQGELMSPIGRLVTQLSCGPRLYGYSRLGNSTPAAGGYVSANTVQPAVGSGGFGLPAQPRTTPASYHGDPPPLSGAGIAVSGAPSPPPPPSNGVVASDTGGLGSVPAAPPSLGGRGIAASDPMPPDPPSLVASPAGAASEHAPAQVSNPKERTTVIERARIIVCLPARPIDSVADLNVAEVGVHVHERPPRVVVAAEERREHELAHAVHREFGSVEHAQALDINVWRIGHGLVVPELDGSVVVRPSAHLQLHLHLVPLGVVLPIPRRPCPALVGVRAAHRKTVPVELRGFGAAHVRAPHLAGGKPAAVDNVETVHRDAAGQSRHLAGPAPIERRADVSEAHPVGEEGVLEDLPLSEIRVKLGSSGGLARAGGRDVEVGNARPAAIGTRALPIEDFQHFTFGGVVYDGNVVVGASVVFVRLSLADAERPVDALLPVRVGEVEIVGQVLAGGADDGRWWC